MYEPAAKRHKPDTAPSDSHICPSYSLDRRIRKALQAPLLVLPFQWYSAAMVPEISEGEPSAAIPPASQDQRLDPNYLERVVVGLVGMVPVAVVDPQMDFD